MEDKGLVQVKRTGADDRQAFIGSRSRKDGLFSVRADNLPEGCEPRDVEATKSLSRETTRTNTSGSVSLSLSACGSHSSF
jgi:hypothetical protein